MTTSEKVAYLKGLAEGLGLDKDNKQDKLLAAIIDVLDTIAQEIEDIEENALDLGDEIDAISDDLAEVESVVYDECCDDEYDDECCDDDEYEGECCGGHHHDDHECCCGNHKEHVFYEVTCPACDNTITVDEDVLALGKIQCPSCGEILEFDLESIEDEEDSPAKD
jgi:hypothetical protein